MRDAAAETPARTPTIRCPEACALLARCAKNPPEMRKLDPKRTTILCPAPIPTVARLLAGIRNYARDRPGWHLISSPPAVFRSHGAALDLQFVRSWRGDGILTSSINPEELRLIRKAGIPAVNLAGHLPENLGVPRVLVNDYQVGRMAAEHLLGLGLTSLAFLGQREPWFARQRLLGFRERAAEAGLDCEVLLQRIDGRTRQGWLKRVDEMAAWASSLPGAVAVGSLLPLRAQSPRGARGGGRGQRRNDLSAHGADHQ